MATSQSVIQSHNIVIRGVLFWLLLFYLNISKVRNIISSDRIIEFERGKQTQQSSEREKTNHPSVYLCTNIIILINFCITSND